MGAGTELIVSMERHSQSRDDRDDDVIRRRRHSKAAYSPTPDATLARTKHRPSTPDATALRSRRSDGVDDEGCDDDRDHHRHRHSHRHQRHHHQEPSPTRRDADYDEGRHRRRDHHSGHGDRQKRSESGGSPLAEGSPKSRSPVRYEKDEDVGRTSRDEKHHRGHSGSPTDTGRSTGRHSSRHGRDDGVRAGSGSGSRSPDATRDKRPVIQYVTHEIRELKRDVDRSSPTPTADRHRGDAVAVGGGSSGLSKTWSSSDASVARKKRSANDGANESAKSPESEHRATLPFRAASPRVAAADLAVASGRSSHHHSSSSSALKATADVSSMLRASSSRRTPVMKSPISMVSSKSRGRDAHRLARRILRADGGSSSSQLADLAEELIDFLHK